MQPLVSLLFGRAWPIFSPTCSLPSSVFSRAVCIPGKLRRPFSRHGPPHKFFSTHASLRALQTFCFVFPDPILFSRFCDRDSLYARFCLKNFPLFHVSTPSFNVSFFQTLLAKARLSCRSPWFGRRPLCSVPPPILRFPPPFICFFPFFLPLRPCCATFTCT